MAETKFRKSTCPYCHKNYLLCCSENDINMVLCNNCKNDLNYKSDDIVLGFICTVCGNKYEIVSNDKTTPRDCPYCNGRKEMPKKSETQYIPKCPTCQSPDIVKLTYSQKTVSIGLFGLFSGRAKKTFHCNNCKYEW